MNKDELAEALQELMRGDGQGEPYVFKAEEVEALQRFISKRAEIERWFVLDEKLKAIGWIGKVVLWLIFTLGGMIAVLDQLKSHGS